MLVGALNYANNAALLLTCLLGAASADQHAGRLSQPGRLAACAQIRAGHAVAGQPIELTPELRSNRRGARVPIRVDLGASMHAFAIEADGAADVRICAADRASRLAGAPAHARLDAPGRWACSAPGAGCIPSSRCWSGRGRGRAGLHPQAPADDARHMRLHRGDDLAALRDYRAGDPQRHIAWKASARHDNLMVKDFEQPQAGRSGNWTGASCAAWTAKRASRGWRAGWAKPHAQQRQLQPVAARRGDRQRQRADALRALHECAGTDCHERSTRAVSATTAAIGPRTFDLLSLTMASVLALHAPHLPWWFERRRWPRSWRLALVAATPAAGQGAGWLKLPLLALLTLAVIVALRQHLRPRARHGTGGRPAGAEAAGNRDACATRGSASASPASP